MNIPKPKKRPWIKTEDKQIWGSKEDQKIYKSARWQRAREIVLTSQPFCQCGRIATVVDHKIPIRQGGDIWSRHNLQGMCKNCHNKKSAKESNQ